MPQTIFVAFSSVDPLIADTIASACEAAKTEEQEFAPWNRNDTSGQPIDRSVQSWVGGANALVADISEPNHNVTFEIGFALGLGNPVRLIRVASKDRKQLEEIGLLHNIGHDAYHSRGELAEILRRPFPTQGWPRAKRNREQPVYILKSSRVDDLLRRTTSGIKKIVKVRFRDFNPGEIDRLTATEAFEQVAQSFGVIAIWHSDDAPEAFRQNQRAAFAIGVARGLDIPSMLLAHHSTRLPLDLDEFATRWSSLADVDANLRDFRERVAEAQEAHVELRQTGHRFLDVVHCGDPAAENEATQLDNYFLETEQFRLTLEGDLNIILGRKGSGKSAIFIQTRNRVRANKNNIVIDLAPEGFQLVKIKEFVLKQLALGTRKELIAAFWEYIIWLELAYKLLEKDEGRVRYDSRLIAPYERLEAAYKQRAEGSGDFSERLASLADRIVSRYLEKASNGDSKGDLASSKTLEIVYGSEIRPMRDEVLTYLKLKGIVFFLFDNLDRFWTPTGFAEVDALIVIGLVECLQDIRKRFDRAAITFQWAIFLRSDVYEFVIKGMADYGKLASASVEWGDRELLLKLFENRVLQGFGENAPSWDTVWSAVSVQTVQGTPTLDFLINASLMRPRYLIRLFETARRRAVTLGRAKIEEADYLMALEELGWQVLEDFDRELVDVVPAAEDLLFDLSHLGKETSLAELRRVIASRVHVPETIDAVIDVLIWTGCIGVRNPPRTLYISDCGFKRPYFRALIRNDHDKCIVFHPTLAAIFGTPGSAPARTSVSRRRGEARMDDRQGDLLLGNNRT
jgi:hypothetical protein